MPLHSVGGVLISLSVTIEPVGGSTIKSVMHGWCDARPTVTFPAAERHHPLASIQLYTAWWQTHMGVNNLPRVVTW